MIRKRSSAISRVLADNRVEPADTSDRRAGALLLGGLKCAVFRGSGPVIGEIGESIMKTSSFVLLLATSGLTAPTTPDPHTFGGLKDEATPLMTPEEAYEKLLIESGTRRRTGTLELLDLSGLNQCG
jgi:hypothetical protein